MRTTDGEGITLAASCSSSFFQCPVARDKTAAEIRTAIMAGFMKVTSFKICTLFYLMDLLLFKVQMFT